MSANPVELITGLANTANVLKGDLIAWAKARVAQVMADANEVRSTVLAAQLVVYVKSRSANFIQDTTDTTTADDGITCIVSSDGKRFKVAAGSGTGTGGPSPQGRLTLASGVPVMTSSQAAAASVLYTPTPEGNQCPVWDGASMNSTTFAELTNILANAATGNAGPAAVIPNAIYDLYFWTNGFFPTLTRSDYWKAPATVTMTIASPCVVTSAGSDFPDGTPIVFTTSGALPTGLVAGTTYFTKRTGAIGTPTATFNVAATVGGAAINTTGTQSGTHTGTAADYSGVAARASGGNCELQYVNGRPLNKNAITNGPAAARGTYLGSIQTNAAGTVDFIYGAPGAGAVAAVFNVWNLYNRVRISTRLDNTAATWTYAFVSALWRPAANSTTFRAKFLRGLAIDAVDASYATTFNMNTTTPALQTAWGLNTQVAASSVATFWEGLTTFRSSVSNYAGIPPMGANFLTPVELVTNTGTITFNGPLSGATVNLVC